MLQQRGYLVLEFLPVYAGTAPTGTGWIAGLKHEVGNYAMEDYAVVVPTLGEGFKVLAGLGRLARKEDLG